MITRAGAAFLAIFIMTCQIRPASERKDGSRVVDSSSVALEELCNKGLRAEAGPAPIYVAFKTGDLISSDVLVALKASSGAQTTPRDLEAAQLLAERFRGGFRPAPVDLPRDSRCAYTHAIPAGNLPITLDLSMPFTNPYDSSQPLGYVAHLMTAGQAGSWYWVELRPSGSTWQVTNVARLPIDD